MKSRDFHACLFLSTIVVFCICASSTKSVDDDWERYKMRYKKKYDNATVERFRRTNTQRTLTMIEKHNRIALANDTNSTFFLRENKLSDMTDEEYTRLLGFRSGKSSSLNSSSNRPGGRSSRRRRAWQRPQYYYNTVNVSSLPPSVNWTARGWVGPVLDQGNCGSCWSHAAVGTLQAQYYNVSGRFVRLSTQNLIDCSNIYGNRGCAGGNMQRAYLYVGFYGIESQDDYPDTSRYTGYGSTCQRSSSLSVTTVDSYRDIDDDNELALQQAVALTGPVAVGIDASSKKFKVYGGGVYNDLNCSSGISQLNHAVLVVGYGAYNGQPYWLIQNSWGTGWGINGYMMLARNANNLCGIATDATFPIIGSMAAPPTTVSHSTALISVSPASSCLQTTSAAIILCGLLIAALLRTIATSQ